MAINWIIGFRLLFSIIILISFISSLRVFLKQKETPILLRGFFIYNIAVIIELLLIWLASTQLINKVYFLNFHLTAISFNFLYLSVFIVSHLKIGRLIYLTYGVVALVLVVTIRSLIPEYEYYNGKVVVIPHLGLLILSAIYFYQFFQTNLSNDLLFDSAFWIITGIFCCSVLVIPIMAIKEYLKNSLSPSTYVSITIFAGVGYAIMHIFFIKAFLCSTRKLI
jgi:hypothetical protein